MTGHITSLFGVVGNIMSLLVFLSPIPTFKRIHKEKSTMGYQSIPYVVAFFSCVLWIYYALLDMTSYLIVSINVVGCIIEMVYIFIYIYYAAQNIWIDTAKKLGIAVGVFAIIFMATFFVPDGHFRVVIVGWICVVSSILVSTAPLLVVLSGHIAWSLCLSGLSFSLTINAMVWFIYGFFKEDMAVALPNVLGFALSVVQMIIYMIYRDANQGGLIDTLFGNLLVLLVPEALPL